MYIIHTQQYFQRLFISHIKRVKLGRPGTSLKMGLLGMANIGKSSTFNILSNLNVPSENIPFCTINPNIAYISVQDKSFKSLCKLYQPQKQVGPILRIVDIAGLVKGASQGYGLGNQFLSNLMQVDGLYHIVRAFTNEQIPHTQGQMNPIRDIKIIRHELIQKDLQIITKKYNDFSRKVSKSQNRNIIQEYQLLKKVKQTLMSEIQIRNVNWNSQQIQLLNKYLLLTSKPMIYLLNLSKADYENKSIVNRSQIQNIITQNGKFSSKIIPYSIEYENNKKEQSQSQSQQQKQYISEINNIITSAYQQLQICHFYTVGQDQVKAWAIKYGQQITQAGGKIHSDFKLSFINADVIHSSMLLKHPQYKSKLSKYSKKQGKNYIVKNGDIINFNCKKK